MRRLLTFLLLMAVSAAGVPAVRMPVLRAYFDGGLSADMEYADGSMQLTDADGNVTELPARFRTRGATARSYMMKPSLNMKLRTGDYAAEADSSLLGMRSCSSWILDAMAIDRICMRNRVAFDIWNDFSHLPYKTSFQSRNGTEGRFVELYINDNGFSAIDLGGCPKLKYFYCHNNRIQELDTRANPLLRHLNATGNPLKRIRSLAPQREERLPLELTADGPGTVGMQCNPVYNAQWKETGEWRQTYYAYPQEGHEFLGWYDAAGVLLSQEAAWLDEYGASRVLTARFS